MSILKILTPNPNGDPEYSRYTYKGYGIGWMDHWMNEFDSIVIHNRICAMPLNENEANKPNAFIVCPVGGRIQTYSMGQRFDITPVKSGRRIYKESPQIERDEAILDSVRRVVQFIDLNQ